MNDTQHDNPRYVKLADVRELVNQIDFPHALDQDEGYYIALEKVLRGLRDLPIHTAEQTPGCEPCKVPGCGGWC